MKIISDNGWLVNTLTSVKERGIIDYYRDVTFDFSPNEQELDAQARMFKTLANFPGNEPVTWQVIGFSQGTLVRFRTTHDSSD